MTSLGATGQEGTVELNKTVDWLSTCACGTQGGGAVVTANFTAGAGSMAGDGVLLALVDSTLQTPGYTAYVTASTCGLASVRPQHALILEFSSRDTTSCGAGGTAVDLRLVRTYGAADPPVVLLHTLQPGAGASCQPACTLAPYMYSGAWWEAQIVLPTDFQRDVDVYTDGTLRMTLRDNSYVPSSFYVMAAGRTSDGANDRNGVANMHVDCVGNTAWKADNDVAHQYYASAAMAASVSAAPLLAQNFTSNSTAGDYTLAGTSAAVAAAVPRLVLLTAALLALSALQ